MKLPNLGHAALFARTEIRRRRRSMRDNTAQLVALAISGLFGAIFLVALVAGGYFGGRALAGGEIGDSVGLARYGAAGLWTMVAVLTAWRVIAQTGTVDAQDGLLTTVPYRDVALGVLLLEGFWYALIGGGPLALAALAFGVGAGSVASVPLILLAAAGTIALGLAGGMALGFAIRNLLARSAFVARHRTGLAVGFFTLYMVLVVTNNLFRAFAPVVAAFRSSPVAWFADLALLAVADGASPLFAIASVTVGGAVLAALVGVQIRLAGLLWYADPADSGVERRASGGLDEGVLSGLLDGVPRPTTRVARKSVLRARRGPVKLLYVAYPAFLLIGPITEAVQSGRVPASLPPLIAFYGAWATGAAFTLNPLGDEGAVLPVTLTSGVSGREFVGGLALAGVLVGVPVSGIATLAVGLLSPLSVVEAAITAVFGVILTLAATAIAAAAGTAFPRFDTAKLTRGTEVVVPSIWAFAAYSLLLGIVWLPGGIARLLGPFLAEQSGVDAGQLLLAGLAATTLLAAIAARLGAGYAVRSFDGYRMD
jgi:hypothetical protein